MIPGFFKIALTGIVLLLTFESFAQGYEETALLFSRTNKGGSARIQALAGSQIALGGDYSSALSNPAGLGMFNRSEFTLSTGITSSSVNTSFLGNKEKDNRTVFNIPGISLVGHMPKENGRFLGGSFAITLSRTNDFNRSTLYAGDNQNNSIVDFFIEQANGATTTQFEENAYNYNTITGLAYYNYLIGPQSSHPRGGPQNQYFTYVGYPVQQEEILVKGATNQWNLSFGGNLADKFFFGGGIGMSSLQYQSQRIFSEMYDNPDTIKSMQLNENLKIRGLGVNVVLGFIARPVNFLQIGISYITPTFYNLTETYDASMSTNWNNFVYYLPPPDSPETLNDNSNKPIATDIITSDYNLRTPSKFSSGVAFISKYGFITGEIEMMNLSNARYSSDTPGISYSDNNDDIKTTYQPVINYRIGAEYRYKIFRVRGGFGIQANSYRPKFDVNNKITTLSGGVGVRTTTFYADFALVSQGTGQYYYAPYTFSDGSGPVVSLKSRVTNGMITVGFTF